MRRAAKPALPRLRLKASLRGVKRRSNLLLVVVVPLRLLHFVRNDDKARITEAKAKPEAARPEHNTATYHCESFFRKSEAQSVLRHCEE